MNEIHGTTFISFWTSEFRRPEAMLRSLVRLRCRVKRLPFLPSRIAPYTTKHCWRGGGTSGFRLPSAPKKIPFAVSAHGKLWDDSYHWMHNVDDPDFVRNLEEETAYTETFMADTEDLQQQLLTEMTGRMPAEISTPPERYGPWLYYQRVPEGEEYPILCRKLEGHGGLTQTLLGYMKGGHKEEILLDWNAIAAQYGYVHIATCRVSPDHNFLAYTLDTDGREIFTLQIKDLRTGSLIEKSNMYGVVSVAWAQDSNILVYTVADETRRPHKVFYTILGSNMDILLFEESDTDYCVDITSTKDGKFITINSNSRTSSEVYVVSTTILKQQLQRVRKREHGLKYFLEHHRGYFYLLTNFCGDNSVSEGYLVARCRVELLPLGNWQNIILAGANINIQDMDIFDYHMVLFIERGGSPAICSINMPLEDDLEYPLKLDDLKPWFFPLPPNICSITPGSNHDFRVHLYRAVVSSPVMPDLIIDFDMKKQNFVIVHQEEVIGLNRDTGYYSQTFSKSQEHGWSSLSEAYVCERKEITSHDGIFVPLTIVYSRRSESNGTCPGLLHGYGAYGEILDKSWSSDLLSLLDRGWIIAYADVRGGGANGISWHHSGAGLNKPNSIKDLIACARYLIDQSYVHEHKLCGLGLSAGGFLFGAAINMFPDLFCSVILKVPFVDVCNTLLDASLPLTVLDHQEFGDPMVKTEFDTILAYSPYENIKQGVCYPSVLITAAFGDPRVGIWQATKWVAKVRELTCRSCSRSVILKADMDGGHFGEGGRYKHCEATAFDYAFLMKAVEVLTMKHFRREENKLS